VGHNGTGAQRCACCGRDDVLRRATDAGIRCGQKASRDVHTTGSAKVASPPCPPAQNHPSAVAVSRDASLSFSGAIYPTVRYGLAGRVEKWRVGTISRQLHVHHSTVTRVLAPRAIPSRDHGQCLRRCEVQRKNKQANYRSCVV
jgi:hypothetical protein